MKKRSLKFVSLVLVLMLVLSFSACGGGSQNGGSEDGQNPIMNFVGNYQCDRAAIFISADDSENGASAIVTWGSSASENSSWVMSGTFDSENLKFEYDNCTRTDYVYSTNGGEDEITEVYNDGHGVITFTEGDPLTLTWQDDKENVADGMVFEYTGELPVNGGEDSDGIANPWSTADSLEAAAEGAGIDGFTCEDPQLSLGEVAVDEYRYMDGIAEIDASAAAVGLVIRKGRADAAPEEGDISGDYTAYAHVWTQNIKGLEVTCFGNRDGEASKTIWASDDYLYSICAYGLGGDDDFGLSADDLNSLINSIQ